MAGVVEMNMLEAQEREKTSSVSVVLSQGVNIKIKDVPNKRRSQMKEEKQFQMTNLQVSISGDKQIIVPSFGATGAIFARHFEVMSNLKRRIVLLQQSQQQ